MSSQYSKLSEADQMLDAYAVETDPEQRELYFSAALRAVEAVLREAADRVRRAHEAR